MANAGRARRARSAPKSSGGKWIQKAIKRPGALTKKAKAAGMSVLEFARKHRRAKGRTGYQSRLALTLSKLRKK